MNPISVLKDLVAINSINPRCQADGPGEAECARFVADFCCKNGLDVQLQEVLPGRSNVLAHVAGADISKRLVFEAHMDTVSIAGMSIPPFQPTLKDGRLYGRGSCDTKGSLAAMMAALVAVKDSRTRRASVTLVASVDEEHAFRGISRFAQDCGKASGAVVGEATELDVIIAHKGVVRWRTTVHGRAAHTSRPELGVNAISKAVKLVAAIEKEWIPRVRARTHPLLERGEMTVSLIGGGTQINFVPDQCWIEIDRRILPGETKDSVYAEMRELLSRLQREDPEFRATIEPGELEDYALETGRDERITQVAHAASRSVAPQSKITAAPYGTDASKLARVGIPSIVIGPGSIAQAHTADEWVDVRQVELAAQVYQRVMEQF
jgi:acetylornithine deacetylase